MSSLPQSGRRRYLPYDRVSSMMQARTGYSSGEDGFQLEKCREYIARMDGICLPAITDIDTGGKFEIKGLLRAVEMAKRNEYDVLVVYETKRFARSDYKKVLYEAELKHYGVEVHYLNLPEIDRSTPSGRMANSILSATIGAMDEHDREYRAMVTSDGRIQKAKRGLVVGGGPPPYGYRYRYVRVEEKKRDVPMGLTPNPSTRAIVERIFREIMTMSTYTIAHGLNRDGIAPPASWAPTEKRPHSGRWSKSTVRNIVTSAVYRGEWRYAGVPVQLDEADVIIAPSVWYAAQERLSGRHQSTRRARAIDAEDAALLRGRLACGHCNAPLSVNTNPVPGPSGATWPDGKQRRYGCSRSVAAWVERNGWTPCAGPLPSLLAADERSEPGRLALVGIEEHAWAALVELYRPGVIERQLAAVRVLSSAERGEWQGQLDRIDQQIKTYQHRLKRNGDDLEDLDPETDPDSYADLKERQARNQRTLTGLRAERERYAATGGPSLSDERMRSILAHVDGVRLTLGAALEDAAEHAPLELRRACIEALDWRGVVRRGSGQDLKVGRDGRVTVEWFSVLDSGQGLLKLCLLHTSSGVHLVALDAAAAA